ncbi:Peroxiredoxin [Filimonas lacunae]|uniref:Peroxiredoxin n=2 Tax=Filimonas lacunae TaxID=477680 RepID=A0A1N7NB00_9BACT|nr:Peroxiredoxin [Filimonas lacunae]
MLSLILLLPVCAGAQKGYTIKGSFSHLPSPAKVYLAYSIHNNRVEDSAEVNNGQFAFTGQLPTPVQASLYLKHDNNAVNTYHNVDGLDVFIENATMTITGVDSMKTAVLKGSVSNEENQLLLTQRAPHLKAINAVLDQAEKMTPAERAADTAPMQSLRYQRDTHVKAIDSLYKAFIASHRQSYVALDAFFSHELMGNFDAVAADREFKLFPEALRTSFTGEKIAARIHKALSVSIGTIAPDFTQNDLAGKPVTLSSFKGRYVLIDFWASWCKPCRAENPFVVKAYQQFKDKGFEILSVSLDASHDDWAKAVEKDGMPWTHVSDLQFWKNAVAVKYGISSVPSNFLLDPSGKIVAKNLRGNKLAETLSTLLH